MVYTPRSESTPEQRRVTGGGKRDKYNERKANKLREQLDTKNWGVAAGA